PAGRRHTREPPRSDAGRVGGRPAGNQGRRRADDRAAGAGRALTDRQSLPLAVCEVKRRGRLLIGEPFFEPGRPLTLGRSGSPAAGEGDLVAVRPRANGRATVISVLGSPDDVAAVLRAVAVDEGFGFGWGQEIEDELSCLP